ncbi:hypothetical protein [Aureispira anguillae]|uniref:Uncharacterized protein n=1 Tax=Aureispira anguillae TaxID=2864201 RepID=A0A915YJY2_9BACT|nr:hypothetical protein [Aureispira anguillae]BDS14615.1 hypothetical protein AsAng_0053960 [Aureispira anguillae]
MDKHKSTYIFTLLFLLLWGTSAQAQKLQVKSILHQQYLLTEDGEMTLSSQEKKEFNLFNKLSLLEKYLINNKKELELDRQERLSYDPKGRHQNTLEYDKEGILQAETKIYWDAYNNKSKVEQIEYDNGQQTSVAVTYLLEYNEDGNKEQEKFFTPNGTQVKERTWFYNNQKEISKSFTWIENYKEPRKEILTIYKRNNKGDLAQSITTEKVNGKEFRKDIRFFSKNYVIEWKTFIEGKLESHFFNEYRDSVIIRTTRQNKRKILTLEEAEKEKERLEKRKNRNTINKEIKGTNVFITNTEYDAYGNILVTTQSSNETVITVTQYVYDDYGNQIKMIKVDKEKNLKEEELNEYDDWGNTSKKIIKKNGKVISEDRYTYEYFPKE